MFSTSLLALALIQASLQDCPPATSGPHPVIAPAAHVKHPDESDSFPFVFALHGGGSVSPRDARSVFGGVKYGLGCCIRGTHPYEAGRTVTLDLGYDRVDSHSGFSGELSLMVPIVRFPPPRSETSTYLRIYGEPGFGLRAGKGFGPYASGKVMLAFLSDDRIFKFAGSPFVEIQTRVPLLDPHRRDTRILAGVIATLCKHCGLD
jgi:hypothetical protein